MNQSLFLSIFLKRISILLILLPFTKYSLFSTDDKLRTFPKFVARKYLSRFLAQHELFKMQLDIKGSIVECGVHQGGGTLAWGKLSSIYEPYNYHRKIIGFDTFEGFPSVNKKKIKVGTLTKIILKKKIIS